MRRDLLRLFSSKRIKTESVILTLSADVLYRTFIG